MYKFSLKFTTVVIALTLAACGTGSVNEEASQVEVEEVTQVVEVPVVQEAEEVTMLETSDEGEEEIPVTGAMIEHLVFPVVFQQASLQRVIDCNTGRRNASNADPLVAPDCDSWGLNRYERPVNERDEYLPEVDIIMVELGQDSEWIYVKISLFMENTPVPDLTGSYALEIDLNLDARGDLLVLVNNPAAIGSEEWGVAGVQVWSDENQDVGAVTAVLPDDSQGGDGYETMLFDSGLGEDPDLAWARVNPEDPNVVELSFKKSILKGKTVFAWWALTSAGPFDLAGFDFNDSYGEEGFTGLDSTCAWMFGQAPINLPNICPTISVPAAEPKHSGGGSPDTCTEPPGGCPPGEYWYGEPWCACIRPN